MSQKVVTFYKKVVAKEAGSITWEQELHQFVTHGWRVASISQSAIFTDVKDGVPTQSVKPYFIIAVVTVVFENP